RAVIGKIHGRGIPEGKIYKKRIVHAVTRDDPPALAPLSGRIVRKLLASFAASEPISLLKTLKLALFRLEKRQQNGL
ncbi:hypothetical protein, partial [uncultured Campylobacter sp.]|uniref:hypothetical protein n=1 Tax=uncultured Campylobacter sp. TaxID=218934 RepID=UPI002623BAE9